MGEFQLAVAGVIILSPSDMSCYGYNSPESLPMMKIGWLWLSEIRVSLAGEYR